VFPPLWKIYFLLEKMGGRIGLVCRKKKKTIFQTQLAVDPIFSSKLGDFAQSVQIFGIMW
jgi:hypothetical protein